MKGEAERLSGESLTGKLKPNFKTCLPRNAIRGQPRQRRECEFFARIPLSIDNPDDVR